MKTTGISPSNEAVRSTENKQANRPTEFTPDKTQQEGQPQAERPSLEQVLQAARAWKAQQEEPLTDTQPSALSTPPRSRSVEFRLQLAEDLGLTMEELEYGGVM